MGFELHAHDGSKKLSCRREAARAPSRWKLCEVTQDHSKSFEIAPLRRARVSS